MMDLSTIDSGITPQAAARIKRFHEQRDMLWQRTLQHAVTQPLTTSLTPDRLEAMRRAVSQFHAAGCTQLVVVGTGGSSLGAAALCALSAQTACVHFMKNCDAESIRRVLDALSLERTAWLIISKSGETMETIATTLAVKEHYAQQGLTLDGRTCVITEQHDLPKAPNTLQQLATSNAWEQLPHPSNLGGRFSVFSVVGMMPLAFAGIDVAALVAQVDAHFVNQLRAPNEASFTASAWLAASVPEQPMHVMLAYGDRLAALTQWYAQIWAESLGKDLIGPTPITAIGAVDQHSQLQLYLGGPRDKLFTILAPNDTSAPLKLADAATASLAYISRHSMQDIMAASAQATIDTMRASGISLRVIATPWDLQHVARFMIDVMMETFQVAAMLGVDPLTQHAVEDGKIRTRNLLMAN